MKVMADYLEPIHSISLKDYAAMVKKIAAGVDEALVFKAMGIDRAVWDELNTLWPQRMAEDPSFQVSVLYSQYFADETPHPRATMWRTMWNFKRRRNKTNFRM
jgi:hypothetical protein